MKQKNSLFSIAFLILPHSASSWILSLAENLASFSLQDRATEWHYYLTESFDTFQYTYC